MWEVAAVDIQYDELLKTNVEYGIVVFDAIKVELHEKYAEIFTEDGERVILPWHVIYFIKEVQSNEAQRQF